MAGSKVTIRGFVKEAHNGRPGKNRWIRDDIPTIIGRMTMDPWVTTSQLIDGRIMNLAEAKSKIEAVEQQLAMKPFVIAHTFERDGRKLHVAITERLRKKARKGRVWKSKQFLTAFKNAEYGFDLEHARSPGGYDGIFLLDRDYRPQNEMMRKVYKQYLDKNNSGVGEIAMVLGTSPENLLAVRLVSHHMRLLGVINRAEDADTLVLVDWNNTK